MWVAGVNQLGVHRQVIGDHWMCKLESRQILETRGPHLPTVCICSWSVMKQQGQDCRSCGFLEPGKSRSGCNYNVMEFWGSKLLFKLLLTPAPIVILSHYNTNINNICNIISNIMGQSSKLPGKMPLRLSAAEQMLSLVEYLLPMHIT